MTKAKPLDRLKLTQEKMAMREQQRQRKNLTAVILENHKELKPEVIVQKENSPFLKMRAEQMNAGGVPTCPNCGSKMERWEGCWRCKQCGTSLC